MVRLSDASQPIGETSHPAPAGPDQVLACDECGALVDGEQRYCVVCGAHRRNVNDPAARYLSQASARSRRSQSDATAQRTRRRSAGSRGVLLGLAIALIPAAAAVGAIAGRSSNNDDSKLIHALKQHQSAADQTTTVQAKAAQQSSTGGASGTSKHTSGASSSNKAASAGKHHGSGKGSGSGSHKTSSASTHTGGGSQPKIVNTKPTQAQKQQGAKVTQKVQKSTGSNYVNGQNSLPGEVVVP